MTTGCDILDFPIRPASVWDARRTDWNDIMTQSARAAWLVTHGLDAGQIFRVEFYLIDAPFARIFTYAKDEDGRPVIVPGPVPRTALAEPRDVLLSELPPERLL